MLEIFRHVSLRHASLWCFVAVIASACASPQGRLAAVSQVDGNAVAVALPTFRGRLEFEELSEVSGLAASRRQDKVLWAINDSGNDAAVYALDQEGRHLGKWNIATTVNRDWEDLASVWHNGDAYLLIGETGDNLRQHSEYRIHIVREPLLDEAENTLYPLATLSFRYSDGKHNVEAIGVLDGSIILISKEPVVGSEHSPGKVYHLPFQLVSNTRLLDASYLTTLAQQDTTIEARFAAALTGVSLKDVTALDFDEINRIAYLLTYRRVIKLPLADTSGNLLDDLGDKLALSGEVIHEHKLAQAEAMMVDSLGQVWLTSEKSRAPLWVLPASK